MSIKKRGTIAESFRLALGFPQVKSKSGAELLFDNDLFSALFRERFGISSENKESFNNAFRDITEGVGDELTKINSVTSSALLTLLVFYKLCNTQGNKSITLTLDNGNKLSFTRAFFEVRNNVVNLPSCVDVALVSNDGKTILYLESKLAEMYEDTTYTKEYGSSYKTLYIKKNIEEALKTNDISIATETSKLILRSEHKPQYLEGIKQTISHLIGLVNGPQEADDQKDYISAYKKATHIIYSPIIYDSTIILNDHDEYSNFVYLYSNVIGKHKDGILTDIKEWAKIQSNKKIEIKQSVITYQELVKENPNWLDDKVKLFYRL